MDLATLLPMAGSPVVSAFAAPHRGPVPVDQGRNRLYGQDFWAAADEAAGTDKEGAARPQSAPNRSGACARARPATPHTSGSTPRSHPPVERGRPWCRTSCTASVPIIERQVSSIVVAGSGKTGLPV
ncbi:hypothetical protein JCM9534A_64040 [Catenuloplanes indicus JCM 9534]